MRASLRVAALLDRVAGRIGLADRESAVSPEESGGGARLAWLLVVLMCGAALAQGIIATDGLEWPGDPDLFRDIAQAQAFVAGGWHDDPFYRDERLWYNPLVPGLVALAAKLTTFPVHRLYVGLGPYLNLLAPLAFAVLSGSLFGPRVAPASLVAFLFLRHAELPAWEAGTYSPWLLPGVFAQALFYGSLAAYVRWREDLGWWRFGLFGAGWGLTALAHTAPAIVLSFVIGIDTLWRVREAPCSRDKVGVLARFTLAAAIAFLAGLPLLWSVVCHYHLRMLNMAPADWTPIILMPGHGGTLLSVTLSPVTLVAALGGLALFRQWSWRSSLLVAWCVPCLALFALGTQPLWSGGGSAPTPVPAFHFLFYLKALEALLFGCGLVWSCTVVAVASRVRRADLVVPIAVVALFCSAYPGYRRRVDFTVDRAKAEVARSRGDRFRAMHWITQHADRHDVFVTSDPIALFVVGPTGRKLVAIERHFSNPYVDWSVRDRYRRRLLEFAAESDEAAFRRLAEPLGVRYLVTEGSTPTIGEVSFLRMAFSSGGLAIYELAQPRDETRANH